MADGLHAEVAAVGHGVEQLAEEFREAPRIAGRLLHDAGEDHVGQEADVFGKATEDDAVKEVGDVAGVEAAGAHGIGDAGETVGCMLCNRLAGRAGFEFLGIEEDVVEDFEVARFARGFPARRGRQPVRRKSAAQK